MENNYIHELSGYLGKLTEEERQDVLDFYSEYILDAGLEDDAAIVAKLGTAKQLARKTLADYSIKAVDDNTTGTLHYDSKPKRNIRAIWFIILAIFAAPIAIPLALALVGVIFGFGIAVLGIIFAMFMCIVAVFIVAIGMLVAGISILGQSLATGALFIGIGITAIGCTMVVIPLAYALIKVLIEMLANFTKFLYHKFADRRLSKEV